MMRGPLVVVLALVLSTLVGCTGGTHDRASTADLAQTTVTDTGFSVTIGEITVTAPGGVAPAGTKVIAQKVSTPTEISDLGLTGSPVIDVHLDGGRQPAVPVTVTWKIPSDGPRDAIAAITSPGPGEPWQGLPVTVNGDQASTQLDHFSLFGFLDGARVLKGFVDAVTGFLGQRYAGPQDCKAIATVNGADYTVKNSKPNLVHACVVPDGDTLSITVASNSPYVFPLTVGNGATVRSVAPPESLDGIVTQAVAQNAGLRVPGVLVPGGTATVSYPPRVWKDNQDAQVISGDIDPILGYVPVAFVGTQMVLSAYGIDLGKAGDTAELGQCLASAVQADLARETVELAGTFPGLLGCGAAFAEAYMKGTPQQGQVGVLTAVIGSLSGLLVTQLRGAVDASTGNQEFAVSISRKATSADPSAGTGRIITPTPGQIRTPDDAKRLTPAGLATFANGELTAAKQEMVRAGSDCQPVVYLDKMRVDDLVSGHTGYCDSGVAFLWANTNGRWKVAWQGQNIPDCPTLRQAGLTSIPAGFQGAECLEQDGRTVTYQAKPGS